jgi:glycine C-acetyltransferase
MLSNTVLDRIHSQLAEIRAGGLCKDERILTGPQRARVEVAGSAPVLNMCANNYLGLADDPRLVEAAHTALERWGYGLSSVRFICGTQQVHKDLEQALSEFMGTQETILYSSCFDANGGLFEALLGPDDAVISDQLNHASIIDGIRLCKAQRLRYANNDMDELDSKLVEAKSARTRLVATDGVFSMDGIVANLPAICDLAERHDAMVMVDDSHAVGFMGARGRGTHEHHDVMDRIDIITGTMGKALGGASGGYTSGHKSVIDLLRQRSRPYLFSNTLAPVITATTLRALELLRESTHLRDKLETNTGAFRAGMKQRGFAIPDGMHPIVPIMLGEANVARDMAERLLAKGVYVVGFSYPVVPEGKARIRVQLSAAHEAQDVEFAMDQFAQVKGNMNL